MAFIHIQSFYVLPTITRPLRCHKRPHTLRLLSSTANTVIDTPKRRRRPIYVSATQQHVGKTTTCLALLSGLQKRIAPLPLGYIKPVGQQHVNVPTSPSSDISSSSSSSANTNTVRVDKDVSLIKQRFHLQHLSYHHMSPVLIPRGYTRSFLDGNIDAQAQTTKILNAYESVSSVSDVVLCEGTGHCGVGAVIGASNARIASLLQASMVLVANGGLGSCYDALELNRALCNKYGVDIAGVVVNKVRPDKHDQTVYYLEKVLRDEWDVPLLACVPDRPCLGQPALADLEHVLDVELCSGQKHRYSFHYEVSSGVCLVTTGLSEFLDLLRVKPDQTVYVCHVTREDVVLAFFAEYKRRKCPHSRREGEGPLDAALVICGSSGNHLLSDTVRSIVERPEEEMEGDVPVIVCTHTTEVVMERIRRFTPKLNVLDVERVDSAVDHYERFIDFDTLLERTGNDVR